MKRTISIFLVLAALISIVAIAPMTASAASGPNFRNTIFHPEGRINTRSTLNSDYNGWFDGSTGDPKIISTGHMRNGVEYWLVEYKLFSGGLKQAYARRDQILVGRLTHEEITVRQNTTVFRKSDMRSSFGTVWGGNRGSGYMFAVGHRESGGQHYLQVIYRLDAGGHRMGFIPLSAMDTSGRGGSNTTSTPATTANAQAVVNETMRWVGSRTLPDGRNASGLCQAFVYQMVYRALRTSRVDVSRGTALQAWDSWKVSTSSNNIPVGAAVYFRVTNPAGHVGIHVGNGNIVHAWTDGIRMQHLSTMPGTYLGWGWQAGFSLQ